MLLNCELFDAAQGVGALVARGPDRLVSVTVKPVITPLVMIAVTV